LAVEAIARATGKLHLAGGQREQHQRDRLHERADRNQIDQNRRCPLPESAPHQFDAVCPVRQIQTLKDAWVEIGGAGILHRPARGATLPRIG
jgi:hypothetical protein